MSFALPDGSRVQVASLYAASKPITAISNASPAVATSAAHGLSAGDYLELTATWPKLTDRIVKVGAAPATDTFKLEGIDSTKTTIYPAGATGSFRKISAWQDVPQVLTVDTSGGETKFVTVQFLEDEDEKQTPAGKSAAAIKLTMADDPSQPYYATLRAADEAKEPIALRIILPAGRGELLYNCLVSFNDSPKLGKGSVMTVEASMPLKAKFTRY